MDLRLGGQFLGGFAAASLICIGCKAVSFPYKYYGLSAASYNGTLLGPKPANDLPLSDCAPTQSDASPCTVILTKDFLALKQDYLDQQAQLIACQHN